MTEPIDQEYCTADLNEVIAVLHKQVERGYVSPHQAYDLAKLITKARRVAERQVVIDSLNELRLLTTCRCHEAWTDRGRHETHCASEYREDVDVLAVALGVGQ